MEQRKYIPALLERDVDTTTLAVAMSIIGAILLAMFLAWLFLRKKAPNRESALESQIPYRMSQDSDTFSLHVPTAQVRDAYRYPASCGSTVYNQLEGQVSPSTSHLNLTKLKGFTKASTGTLATYNSSKLACVTTIGTNSTPSKSESNDAIDEVVSSRVNGDAPSEDQPLKKKDDEIEEKLKPLPFSPPKSISTEKLQ